VVREFSRFRANWRADETAQQFLTNSGVPVISDIDTPPPVRHQRSRGVMRGVLWSLARTAILGFFSASGLAPPLTPLLFRDIRLATRVFNNRRKDDCTRVIVRASPSDRRSRHAGIRHHVFSATRIKRNILRRAGVIRGTAASGGFSRRQTARTFGLGNPTSCFFRTDPAKSRAARLPGPNNSQTSWASPSRRTCLGHQDPFLSRLLEARPTSLKFGHRGRESSCLINTNNYGNYFSHNHVCPSALLLLFLRPRARNHPHEI